MYCSPQPFVALHDDVIGKKVLKNGFLMLKLVLLVCCTH